MTQLDPANDPSHKELFYSRVDSQVVADLIKNILTDAEYSKLMLKRSIFTFEDDTTGIDLIDGPCLLKLLMDRVDPNIVIGIEVLCANIESVSLILLEITLMLCSRIWKKIMSRSWTITVLANQYHP